MSRSSDNGSGGAPGRPAAPAPAGARPVAPQGQPNPQFNSGFNGAYAEQEAFDGAYDSYGDPLTGPPSRDPRLPDQRGPDQRAPDQRAPDQRGLGGHGTAGQYAAQYPVAKYGAPTAPATGGQQPYDPYDGGYQTDPRYAPDQRQPDPSQGHRPDGYGRPPEQQARALGANEQMRRDPQQGAPGSLRALLPPQQPVQLQPGSPGGAQPPRPAAAGAAAQPPVPPAVQPSQMQLDSDLEPDTQRPAASSGNREMYAPARTDRTDKAQGNAPIVPAGSVTGRSLTLVISIMCFLACLTSGAVYMMNQSASAWLMDIASEVTVQVEGRDKADGEKTLNEVAAFLNQQPGIVKARVLSLNESGGLLEPWIGNAEALKTLAVPRLIALELDRRTPPDFEPLRAKLASAFKGVSLDDHRQWQTQIRTVTRSFALGGLAILLLVAAATTAIIISATRAAMASNREIVEVLHFVGATDRFIAREFERNFLRLGVRAGLVGALSAMVVFALMPTLMELLGGGTVSLAEMRRLVGSGTLDMIGYAVLAALVVVVAALCMLTSRFSVYRILHTRQ
jgi:cell division transport system permease protein